jgi:hypothetical protein
MMIFIAYVPCARCQLRVANSNNVSMGGAIWRIAQSNQGDLGRSIRGYMDNISMGGGCARFFLVLLHENLVG